MIENTKEAIDLEVERFVRNYREMKETNRSLYEESMWNYADMANGGRAHDGLDTYLRDRYYKGYPDRFFFLVLSALGEFEKYTQVAGESKS
tara:strand:+ start:270 stop:542 length:273 start_codon:yes stop_codon:yes gene_type:complete